MQSVIELDKVTKSYGSIRGVNDINLNVPAGSVFGFLGPNGAGKSTTINMLLDFIRPTSGQLKLFGLDSRKASLEIHARIGFLAGDMALDRSLNGWQQLEYLGNLRGKFDKSYVAELAERLDCKLDRTFKTLSRGNKQKVGLIAALMNKPELLIFDEPTSGLDPLIQSEFNKIILDHQAAGGTAFISSHVLSEVQEICDQVTFIREGQLIATKTMKALTSELPKQLRITSSDEKLFKALEKIPGLKTVRANNGVLEATFTGDVNQLLKLVSDHKVTDFSLNETDLETIFMQFYEGHDA